MRVACLFRQLFAKHNDSDLAIMKRRIYCLHAMTISVALVLIILSASQYLLYKAVEIVILCSYIIFYWAITLMTLCAMRHILQSQKSLERIGIFANRYIMTSYVCLQSIFALCMTIYIIASMMLLLKSDMT